MSKKNIKYIVIGLGALMIVCGLAVYNMVFNAEHREIFEETTAFTMPANDLQLHFANNQKNATTKYMNQVIETDGFATEIGTNTIVLENKVLVYFLNDTKEDIAIGDKVKIKGRCVGFDELLTLVKIDQATTLIH